jgi:hypothetical protein
MDSIGYNYSYVDYLYPGELHKGDSGLLLELNNTLSDLYDFANDQFTIVLYDNSYDVVKSIDINHISESSSASESDMFFTSVSGNEEYFVEVYLGGLLFHTIHTYLEENSITKERITPPKPGKVQFIVTDSHGDPASNVFVKNWIFEEMTDEHGTTNWADMPSNRYSSSESYAGSATFPDGRVFWSESFTIYPGEQKIIYITESETK